MTIERTINGYWRLSDVVDGFLVSKVYIGYSKEEALRAFRGEYYKGVRS